MRTIPKCTLAKMAPKIKVKQKRFVQIFSCGEGGIRTLEQIAPLLDFESSAFNRSAASPNI